MKFIVMFILVFFILIFGGGVDFIRSTINEYTPKVSESKKTNLAELNRAQEIEIKKLQDENEVLRGLLRVIAKSQMEAEELNRVLLLTKNKGPVSINLNGNVLPCINTGITIECN